MLTCEVARRLAERAAPLLLHLHDHRQRARDLVAIHPTLQADLGVPEGRRLLAGWAERHAPLGGIVLGASRFSSTPVRSVSLEEIQRIIALELESHLDLVLRLHPLVVDRGRIVFFSDVGVRLGWPSYPAYLAAKGGVEAATRSLARSLGPRLIVTCVAPGSIEGAPAPPEGVVTGDTALGRTGLPEEVAEAVVRWLGLPAVVIAGQCLRIDGGRRLGP